MSASNVIEIPGFLSDKIVKKITFSKLGQEKQTVWHEIALNNYRTYFMIRQVDNPFQHKSCSFAMDWNAYILQCLLKTIVHQHKTVEK